jgi:hypothetical protein
LKSSRSSRGLGNSREYRKVFIRRVHVLVKLGYDRLDSASYKNTDEWTITGDLNAAIEAVCDDPPAAVTSWIRFYHPSDESPVNVPGRSGKHRQKVDIRIVSAVNRPRTRLLFEAKRLCSTPKHPVSVYLGPKGLGCFTAGEYARDQPDGGMLGYVQSGTEAQWMKQIKQSLKKSKKYHLKSGPKPVSTIPGCVSSEHDRPTVGKSIEIFHTLLTFH